MLDIALYVFACAVGWCFAEAQDGTGPFVRVGAWLDARARRKSLRLLNSVAYFAWDQAEDLAP